MRVWEGGDGKTQLDSFLYEQVWHDVVKVIEPNTFPATSPPARSRMPGTSTLTFGGPTPAPRK